MIKANELRIGNWVNDEFGRAGYVVAVSGNSVRVKLEFSAVKIDSEPNFDGLDIQPIPLTPEILESCGFKSGWNGYELNEVFIELYDEGFMFVDADGYARNFPPIKYLHQLQNIFYFHTQTELEVKLPVTA